MRQSRALKDIIRQDQDGVWFIDLFHFPENDSIDTETRATSKSMIGPRIGLSFSNSPLIFATNSSSEASSAASCPLRTRLRSGPI
jgi:hypothetical protein